MDEAFKPIGQTIVELVDQRPVLGGPGDGQRIIMTALEVELPVELAITRGAGAELQIGSTPPLYALRTTFLPSFHQLRLRASLRPDKSSE